MRKGSFMALFDCFYPDVYLDSTYEIDFEKLYRAGYRGVIFDIDNTLVPHGAPADDRSTALFERLRSIGFDTLLLSNNKEPRVKMFNDEVHSRYIYKAGKPSPKNYQKAMDLMHTTAETTVFVGDQLFTDVWGARKVGIFSILVKPIHPKEEIQIVLKRRLEWIVLFFYRKTRNNNSSEWRL
jgi:HAD superfamily phosphatase (TIGR01668 family)